MKKLIFLGLFIAISGCKSTDENAKLAQRCQHYIKAYLADQDIEAYIKRDEPVQSDGIYTQLHYHYQKPSDPAIRMFYTPEAPVSVSCEQQQDQLVIKVQSDQEQTIKPAQVIIQWQAAI